MKDYKPPKYCYQWKFNVLHPEHPDFEKKISTFAGENHEQAVERLHKEMKGLTVGFPVQDGGTTVEQWMEAEFVGMWEKVQFPTDEFSGFFGFGEEEVVIAMNRSGYFLTVPPLPESFKLPKPA